MDKILFQPEGEPAVEFYVLEQTTIAGRNYILVTDTEEGEGEALILQDVSAPEDTEALYQVVDNDDELKAVAAVFENLLEDTDTTLS